jgi:hypothetical protein
VYGFSGDTKEDHIAHLAQMSTTVLPALHDRWLKPAPAAAPDPAAAPEASSSVTPSAAP